jgi:hypothetical protein
LFWGQGLQRNLIALGEFNDDIGKGTLSQFHEEFDPISPRATAETIIELFARTDAKTGCFFFMEGTQSDIIFSSLPQDNGFGDDINNVNPLFHFFDGIGVETRDIHI